MKVLGIGSSMRKNSFSTDTLRKVLEIISVKYKTEARLVNLFETQLPIYRPSTKFDNENVKKVTDDVNWANVFVLASPDYHGSMSGTMKNFLDFFWKEFSGKTFGYIVSSHEKGLTVMDQMRTAVRQCYAWSLPYGISINGREDLGSDGKIVNSILQSRMEMLARDLVVYGRLIYWQFSKDQDSAEQNTFAHYYL
ncbi:MAG: NAD(P)H-dependent oxidoreductase [Nitrososphaeraceae archaeon]|nr:NAD(P)H-dependent oxidoreductase [Nitrososphaeraceae archaeon]MDW0196242.1 NAD(P)H-dependent oxidoreductase [Nitrososphaeraceae archaeon]MDW0223722.1 NAD(P)H-dependent oxidoreductase [Nitrososphaeraceae archaeon]MDW0256294.1 NAD(P)H-dependent oxidoreductase [Nitrososphaeraceae archaeon]MDW0287009.1 NAD(P)H-dependent oxidoreductase [Nitrososphaeraceae archaeon]